jgi:hypothetical protein
LRWMCMLVTERGVGPLQLEGTSRHGSGSSCMY